MWSPQTLNDIHEINIHNKMITLTAILVSFINSKMNTDKTNVISVDVSSDIRNTKYVFNGFIRYHLLFNLHDLILYT